MLRKEIHELRTRNIAIRADCNKFRSLQSEAAGEMLRVKLQLEAEMNTATRSLKQFKNLDVLLIKKDTELKQLKKAQDRLKTKFSDLQALFTNTLNVKLRYEQIIKNLMENEKINS